MIYTDLTKKALKVCFDAHKNQLDKSGMPYVFHPFHVAEQMGDEISTIVALLHDVVEDSKYTLDDLNEMGFPKIALDAIEILTHKKEEPYMEYISRVACNEIASKVKLADLEHNSDLTRLDEITDKDLQRYEKYKVAKEMLKDSFDGK